MQVFFAQLALLLNTFAYIKYERETGILPQKESWVNPYTMNGREYFTNSSPKKQQKVVVKPK